MINENIKYSLDDLTIVPAKISSIDSRKECYIYDSEGMLPIFAAPMMGVTNEKNAHIYKDNKVNVIIPRTVEYKKRLEFLNEEYWVAFSLKEFKKIFCDNPTSLEKGKKYKVCVDLANGHMATLYSIINEAKEKSISEGEYRLRVMTGNIANPDTYKWICENANVDYIRVSVGTGSNCITASNVGTFYPMASLISECAEIRKMFQTVGIKTKSLPAIVADGGMKNYDDVTKALALGADYVMIGSLFTGLLESAAEMNIEMQNNKQYPALYDHKTGSIVYYTNFNYSTKEINIWNGNTEEDKRSFLRLANSIMKKSIGMSTKEAQIAINKALEEPIISKSEDLKTSEGITKFIECKHTLSQWLDNMKDYLRSSMSYTGKRNLKEFTDGSVELVRNSAAAINSINK